MIGHEMIECQICHRPYAMISPQHLKTHKLSVNDYKRLYPDAPIRSAEVTNKAGASLRKGNPIKNRVAHDPNDLIYCQVCGKSCKQLTQLHLNLHNLSMKQYREKYPEAPLANMAIKSRLSIQKVGIARSQETIDKIKATKASKPYVFVSRPHTEETKGKISQALQKHYEELKKTVR